MGDKHVHTGVVTGYRTVRIGKEEVTYAVVKCSDCGEPLGDQVVNRVKVEED